MEGFINRKHPDYGAPDLFMVLGLGPQKSSRCPQKEEKEMGKPCGADRTSWKVRRVSPKQGRSLQTQAAPRRIAVVSPGKGQAPRNTKWSASPYSRQWKQRWTSIKSSSDDYICPSFFPPQQIQGVPWGFQFRSAMRRETCSYLTPYRGAASGHELLQKPDRCSDETAQ